MTLKEDLVLFCNTTSLRGVAKATKSPTRPLRAVWTLYVVLMAAALTACVCFIVADYLQYKTIIQAALVINDESDHSYPALTFCNHYPFSESARSLWSTGAALSPTNYSRMIRRQAFEVFNESDYNSVENLMIFDTKRVYYQSLPHGDALRLSFTVPQVFVFCIRGHGHLMDIGEYNDCKFIIKSISLPSFFTCFQVQISQPNDWITLIVHVSRGSQSKYEEAFVQDIFEQADGIRLQVHENDTYPDPTAKGIHIEPGKLMEINYRHVRWQEADTPKSACLKESAARARRVRDLDQEFAYSAEGCVKAAIGRLVLRRCGCYYAEYLREDVPNATHPYCGDMRLGLGRIERNLICLSGINFTRLKVELSRGECLNPCTFSEFETFTSQTVWKSTDWQLHWLLKQSESFDRLRESQRMPPGANRTNLYRSAERDLVDLFTRTNLSTVTEHFKFQAHSDELAYLTIRRQSCNTIQKTEAQSMNFSALMSQVGGLCSLFLGLTCAFAVELIEVALMRQQRRLEGGPVVAAVASPEGAMELRKTRRPDCEEAGASERRVDGDGGDGAEAGWNCEPNPPTNGSS